MTQGHRRNYTTLTDVTPESKGIGKRRLENAMDRLFRIGAIERGDLGWRDDYRRPAVGLRECAANVRANGAQTRCANAANAPSNPQKSVQQTQQNITPYTTYREGEALGAASPSDQVTGFGSMDGKA